MSIFGWRHTVSTRWWGPFFLLCNVAAGFSAAVAQPHTPIASILSSPDEYDEDTVVLSGEVTKINYTPDIRESVSLLSFELSDSTGKIKVLNQTAAMLSRGDKVRVTGVFRHSRLVQGVNRVANEIDSTRGEIEVISGRKFEEMEEASESGMQNAVPTTIVDTPWTLSVDVASLLSALFAAIATVPILLHSRRFNLELVMTEPAPREVVLLDSESALFCATVRLISTKSIAPQLTAYIEIEIGKESFSPTLVQVVPSKEIPLFPVPVKEELILRLECRIPNSLSELVEKGYVIVFRDAFCSKKFLTHFGGGTVRRVAAPIEPAKSVMGPSLPDGLETRSLQLPQSEEPIAKRRSPAKKRQIPKARPAAQ